MSSTLLAQASPIESVGTPGLWAATIGAVLALLVLDFAITRKPHEVSMREAVGWSVFVPSVAGAGVAPQSTRRSPGRPALRNEPPRGRLQ